MPNFAETFDALLLDLDGTVFTGHEPTPDAVDILDRVRARTLWVTNNASRNAEQVADHLGSMGFAAQPADVVTSAQAAAALLAQRLSAGARVLVIGSAALAGEISAVGLTPVGSAAEAPVAVVQGYSADIGWTDLAEASLAVHAGALWVATNTDLTLPSDRGGMLPGNGTLVAAVATATGVRPEVAGKPEPTLMRAALSRGEFRAPLVVGDRLNTDIAGANGVGLPSLAVLTGVCDPAQLAVAIPAERPTFLTHDLRGLFTDIESARIGPQPSWRAEHNADEITLRCAGEPDDDGLGAVRVAVAALWEAADDGRGTRLVAGDETAANALRRWSL
ncbi:HAD-IIA family hydrolase [Mycolicibacterium brumae]|uniref:HAD family hydrolase n=1 Tax=Mycolicibacterium brumae TaxID=85968 RepID=A0A2G5P4X9_9MYCO|nr:HAD-IIA family hydrolase [Mycolicibacterium brumae]MCV7193855.1 HAD-IIA family hydrolase [Mycolicibacterium brumae]PIB73326.1 HAD family hydrolase [Mycolicibacterium brumae]RWA18050.1 hypothetical protein MBRU_18090 [Mycolicibacterium brumae DSM 44177]UWW08862.1 HAD-IIA family hydrolase [Mycolicibacterium brumae]